MVLAVLQVSSILFIARASDICADDTCTNSDHFALLQSAGFQRDKLKEVVRHGLDSAEPLLHEGEQCWHSGQCGRQGGACPQYCGTQGVCCRAGGTWSEPPEIDDCGADGHGIAGMHTCQWPPPSAGLANGDFEDFHLTDARGYQYTSRTNQDHQPVTESLNGWQVSGDTVVITTGNGPWGSTQGVSGNHFFGLQRNAASIKQTVGGHTVGGTYNLVVHVARRTNNPASGENGLRVTADGVEIANSLVTNTEFERRAFTYTADNANVEIELAATGADGDRTVFVDAIEIPENLPGYRRDIAGCVHASNIELFHDSTQRACAERCDVDSGCVAFEFGVDYGASGRYQPSDCQLQSSADSSDCDGRLFNLDLYVKE